MRKVGGTLLAAMLVTTLVTTPSFLDAQRRAAAQPVGARHEFGVDAGLTYYDPDGGETGLRLGTPVDVRVGFLPRAGKLMWEGRLVLELDGAGGGTGEGTHVVNPTVNVVSPMGIGTHRRGMFLTGGVGLNLVDTGVRSGTGFSLNGAVGWRKPYGTGALRYEVGLRWDSEITDGPAIVRPSTLSVGGRIGLSLWH